MNPVQIITKTERRRNWSRADRERILEECRQPNVTIKSVAKRYDISESVIYSWRTQERKKQAYESLPQGFIFYGEVKEKPDTPWLTRVSKGRQAATIPIPVLDKSPDVPLVPDQPPALAPAQPSKDERFHPYPGDRPGTIDIHLNSGEHLVVDAYVNERALHRILRTIRSLT